MKLSTLLGLRDKLEKNFANMLDDMFSKFKNKQGLFLGKRETYVPIEGFADEPTKRSFVNVSSTVSEQLQWFKEHTRDYLENVFSIEKTNSTGVFAALIVEGERWGEYSTLELLRLKSILDGKIRAMIDEIPIRQESIIWTKTDDPTFGGRDIFQSPIDEGFSKTTLKRKEIVNDPHIKDSPNRPPVVQDVDSQVNIGKYTKQEFSGAITNLERAQLKVRYNTLYNAVIEALENANAAESVKSNLGDRFLNYLIK